MLATLKKKTSRVPWNAFDVLNTGFMLILLAIMLYPLLNTLAISLSSYSAYARNPSMVFPGEFSFKAYETILQNRLLRSSYGNTLFVTFVGTAINMLLTIITAYPLSKRDLKGIRAITFFFVFTMLFSGGIIPNYFLVRSLGLLNTHWALIFPVAINTYNLTLVKTYYQSIPDSLEESAAIEGANDLTILFRIILPVSVPTLVAITLFYAVANWNQYFLAVVYTNKQEMWTLQVLLREMVSNNSSVIDQAGDMENTIIPYVIRCATIVVVIVPILFVYPFLQRYFISGVMLGAVKE